LKSVEVGAADVRRMADRGIAAAAVAVDDDDAALVPRVRSMVEYRIEATTTDIYLFAPAR